MCSSDLLDEFSLTGLVKSGNDIVVSFPSEVGLRYRIERTDAVTAGSWTPVADNLVGTGAIQQVTDAGAVGQRQRFYRGRVLP